MRGSSERWINVYGHVKTGKAGVPGACFQGRETKVKEREAPNAEPPNGTRNRLLALH